MSNDDEQRPVRERIRGLGRGLSSLFEDDDASDFQRTAAGTRMVELPIEFLQPNKSQPRQSFDPEKIKELAESIRERGVLQPILVRPVPNIDDQFEIVAGERRWRAAQIAQLHQVPVIIKDIDDALTLEIALIENIQRENLTPIEEAKGFQRLMNEYAHTQEQLAETVGKSRSHIANTVRLLSLPESVQAMLQAGELTAGHARSLITSADPVGLARQIVQGKMSVRDTEKLVQQSKPGGKRSAGSTKAVKDADTLALESSVSAALGLSVDIAHKGLAGGKLTVTYKTLEQLDDILRRLRQSPAGPF